MLVGAGWLITIVDDHSRLVTASHFFEESKSLVSEVNPGKVQR